METDHLRNSYVGSLMADALAMPVHWYYDRARLRQDYGVVDHFMAPRNPHPGSILWRSTYVPLNYKGDILRDQAVYWGQKEIHYHQFLHAGENTLNFKLAQELHHQVTTRGGYDADAWLDRYIELMLQPGWNQDSYVEEYHRAFFTRYAQGKRPRNCGISDEHIGGLATVPALVAGLGGISRDEMRKIVKLHVSLTHAHPQVLLAADTLVRLLFCISEGGELREALRSEAGDWFSSRDAERWQEQPDEVIVGQRFSPACYIAEAMPAALYLAWKYHAEFSRGITANAMVGGDNCHRGAVVGGLLGAANPEGLAAFERANTLSVKTLADEVRLLT